MQDLVDGMMHEEPDLRPSIEDVVSTFSEISKPQTLGESKLRSFLVSKHKPISRRALRTLQHILPRRAAVSEP